MKNRIDKILLGILWLLAVLLGTSFWFNARLGFNIFSDAHWDYLAYLQASQTPITSTFYISLILAVVIAITGLYLLVRPRFRRIRLPIVDKKSHTAPTTPAPVIHQQNAQPAVSTPVAPSPAVTQSHAPIVTPAPTVATNTTPQPARPPRLNIALGTLPQTPSAPQLNIPSPSIQTPTPVAAATNTAVMEYPEIKEIFTNAKYVLKPSQKIEGIPIPLIALGTNENMWLGGVGIKTTELRTVIDKLSQVFTDTLDDIYININGFVIAAPDAPTSEFQDILMFDSISALRAYMANVPNPPIPDDDAGNFDAYSEYIDTVLNYIGKV